MHPGEHIVFNTIVEPGGPKRRASRLLAMAVTPKKQHSRPRELVLTTHRILCVKHKPGRAPQVRAELFVKPPAGKEKDLRSLVSSIEPKGDREFVIITVRVRAGPAGWRRGADYAIQFFSGRAAGQVALLCGRQRVDSVDVDTQGPRGD